MTAAQMSLDDLLSDKMPSFSATVVAQNAAEVPSDRIDPAQWSRQATAVYEAMQHGDWMTKAEISFHSGASEHAVSARLSDLKKKGILSEKRKAKDGNFYQYRLLVSSRPAARLVFHAEEGI